MNDSQNSRALDAVNGKRPRFLRPSLQNALGALLVVLVTTSVGVVFTFWDNLRTLSELLARHLDYPHATQVVEWKEFDALRDQFELHENDGIRKHQMLNYQVQQMQRNVDELLEFKNAGDRFTREDGDRLEAELSRLRMRLEQRPFIYPFEGPPLPSNER